MTRRRTAPEPAVPRGAAPRTGSSPPGKGASGSPAPVVRVAFTVPATHLIFGEQLAVVGPAGAGACVRLHSLTSRCLPVPSLAQLCPSRQPRPCGQQLLPRSWLRRWRPAWQGRWLTPAPARRRSSRRQTPWAATHTPGHIWDNALLPSECCCCRRCSAGLPCCCRGANSREAAPMCRGPVQLMPPPLCPGRSWPSAPSALWYSSTAVRAPHATSSPSAPTRARSAWVRKWLGGRAAAADPPVALGGAGEQQTCGRRSLAPPRLPRTPVAHEASLEPRLQRAGFRPCRRQAPVLVRQRAACRRTARGSPPRCRAVAQAPCAAARPPLPRPCLCSARAGARLTPTPGMPTTSRG